MNIVELNPILEELEKLASAQEKTASQKEECGIQKTASDLVQKLRSYEPPVAGFDFHTHYEMMTKKASSVARELLGLDSRKTGNPTVEEVVAIAFGGK